MILETMQIFNPDYLATVVQFTTALSASIIIGIIGYLVYKRDPEYKLNVWFAVASFSIAMAYLSLGSGLVPYLHPSGNANSFYSIFTFKFNLTFVVLGLTYFFACGFFLNFGQYWIEKLQILMWIPAVITLLGLFLFDSFVGVGQFGDVVIRKGDFMATAVYTMIFILLIISFVLYLKAYLDTKYRPVLYFTIGVAICLSSSVFSLLAGILNNRMLDNLTLVLITIGIVIIYTGFKTKPEEKEVHNPN